MDKMGPVLIYVPGLGNEEANTADNLAEILARAISRSGRIRHCSTKLSSAVTAPRGLKVSKSVVGENDQLLLQLFELDYKSRLDNPTGIPGPTTTPGIIQSTKYTIFGSLLLIWACRRPAKDFLSKLQLWLGFSCLIVLILAWILTLYSALKSVGVGLPGPFSTLLSEESAGWAFAISGTATVITWSAIRRDALLVAAVVQRLIDYTRNAERVRDSVCLVVDDAISGLSDDGWGGPVHILGYSFGSLVSFDATFPHVNSLKLNEPFEKVASLVTVGIPLDLVRLYFPCYSEDRRSRKPGIPWVNVYNAADVFGSNLRDGNDVDDLEKASDETAKDFASFSPKSIRYLEEELTLLQLFMAKGFRVHSGYWGTAGEAHCFETLLEIWMPSSELHV